MKKVLIGLLLLAVVAVIVVAVVLHLTSGMLDSADQFFTTVQEGDLPRAYGYLSREFQAATSLDELRSFLEGSELAEYQNATWSSRSIENDQGRLQGTVETKQGGKIPIEVTLVKEEGAWKILSIQKAAAGLIVEEDTKQVPDVEELERMTDDSMQELALAINSRDFSDFHKGISSMWQAQITAEELYEIFSSFSGQNADLTVLRDLNPTFSETPSIGADGVLSLMGYYASQPSVTYFDMKFIYEHPQWKLVGIGIELK